MPQLISPAHQVLPLTQNANHHTDMTITTLILEIQSLCHARNHPAPPPFASSQSDTKALQSLIRQKLDRLQHQILKRAMRKLEELLDYDMLPEKMQQQQKIDSDEDDDDDGVLLPVPLKIGSRRVRARAVRKDVNRNQNFEGATNMDPLERLERKVMEVQIYASN